MTPRYTMYFHTIFERIVYYIIVDNIGSFTNVHVYSYKFKEVFIQVPTDHYTTDKVYISFESNFCGTYDGNRTLFNTQSDSFDALASKCTVEQNYSQSRI